jgi:RecA-family ATPase
MTTSNLNEQNRQGILDENAASLPIMIFDACDRFIPKRPIIKGLLYRGETSSLIGPPGSGKSALQTEIAFHAAAGRDWRGNRVKERVGVLILALERADLYRRRLHGYRVRDNASGLPIAISVAMIDLLDANCVGRIVATVRNAE